MSTCATGNIQGTTQAHYKSHLMWFTLMGALKPSREYSGTMLVEGRYELGATTSLTMSQLMTVQHYCTISMSQPMSVLQVWQSCIKTDTLTAK